jgi:hypothetical protein
MMATDMPIAQTDTTTNPSASVAATGQGIRTIRWLVFINMALVALQALSAGLFLSGYGRAVPLHGGVALALQLGGLMQAVTAIILWRRRRIPAWLAGVSIGLFVMVFLQAGLGFKKQYWLHVPIGVGLFGWLTRLSVRLETLLHTTRARS